MFPENMKTVFHPSQLPCLSNVSILGIEGLLPRERVGKSGLAAAVEGYDFVTLLIANISFPLSKDENEISLSTRNTIPWKLECELNEGYSRDFGYE